MLLCHCTGTLGRVWDPVARRMPEGLRILAPDTRGQGDSEAPDDREAYAWFRSGEDLRAILHGLSIRGSVTAVGHSAGAAHVAYAALSASSNDDHPSLGSLILIDPIIAPPGTFGGNNPLSEKVRYRRNDFDSIEAAHERLGSKPPMNTWHPEALEAYLAHAFRPDGAGVTLKCPGAREAWFYELGGASDAFERLGEIAVPTLVVTGSESYVAPLADVQHQSIPGSRLHTVAGAGHFIPQERPEEIAALIQEFMPPESTR